MMPLLLPISESRKAIAAKTFLSIAERRKPISTRPVREPAVVKQQNRPSAISHQQSAIGNRQSAISNQPSARSVLLPIADSRKPIAVRPVRGDFKGEQSLNDALRGSSSNSARALLGAQNEVTRVRLLRNEVSRKHDMVVGDTIEARVATRNDKLRVVLRGESGVVDTVYRSGRIHVNWSRGGSGWYTITEIKNRAPGSRLQAPARKENQQTAIGSRLLAREEKQAPGSRLQALLPSAESRLPRKP